MLPLDVIYATVETGTSHTHSKHILELTYVGVLVFSVIHIWPHYFHGILYKSKRIATSFSGGMATAYVFIHLLGELQEGYELLGMSIHVITLIGFLTFYGLQRLIWRATLDSVSKQGYIFYIELVFYCVYNYLLIYAIPEQFEDNIPLTFLYIISIGFHLLHNDYSLSAKYPRQFRKWGRHALVFSLFMGLFTDIFAEKSSKLLSDALLSFLAGSIIFNVFYEELPAPENASFRWFAAGIGVYGILLIGIWTM